MTRWLVATCWLVAGGVVAAVAIGLPVGRAESPSGGRLTVPPLVDGPPAAGVRVIVRPPEYAGTDVHHVLYLPPDWSEAKRDAGETWPVIVEYTGNRFAESRSTGQSRDAALGFGLSGGRSIWVVLPCISEDHRHNEVTWWGDRGATVNYAKRIVPRICEAYGGDPDRVVLCGFSRGAIGVNLIGLHDDEIAGLWAGFFAHDHYDGVREWKGTTWGSPLRFYQRSAERRLRRLGDRPVLVTSDGMAAAIHEYLRQRISLEHVSFVELDVAEILRGHPGLESTHPHTDRWLLADSPERRKVWAWLDRVTAKPVVKGVAGYRSRDNE